MNGNRLLEAIEVLKSIKDDVDPFVDFNKPVPIIMPYKSKELIIGYEENNACLYDSSESIENFFLMVSEVIEKTKELDRILAAHHDAKKYVFIKYNPPTIEDLKLSEIKSKISMDMERHLQNEITKDIWEPYLPKQLHRKYWFDSKHNIMR